MKPTHLTSNRKKLQNITLALAAAIIVGASGMASAQLSPSEAKVTSATLGQLATGASINSSAKLKAVRFKPEDKPKEGEIVEFNLSADLYSAGTSVLLRATNSRTAGRDTYARLFLLTGNIPQKAKLTFSYRVSQPLQGEGRVVIRLLQQGAGSNSPIMGLPNISPLSETALHAPAPVGDWQTFSQSVSVPNTAASLSLLVKYTGVKGAMDIKDITLTTE